MQAAGIVVFSAATGTLHYVLSFISATHLHQYCSSYSNIYTL